MIKFTFTLLIVLLTSLCSYSQNKDTVIIHKNYTSFYSFKLKAPKFVKYELYQGGGDCKRNNFHFTSGGIHRSKIATSSDYYLSNFDKSHLANSEDFAYDCELDELTFRYYNCFPNYKELNRNIWKKDENLIRKMSQTDSLIIFVGGFYGDKTIGNGVSVPITCFKMVYSLKTHQFIYSYIFTNDKNPIKIKTDPNTLIAKIANKYYIDIRNFLR